MRHPNGRSFAIGRIVAVLLLALAVATPASAQFGGLKKKLKGDAVNKAVDKAVDGAAGSDSAKAPTETGAAASTAGPAGPTAKAVGGTNPATPESTGGALVMTPEVVDRLIAGLKAGKAAREKAKTEDTPYARYLKASAAYEVAKSKCDTAQQTWPNRLMANEKLMAKSQQLLEKMTEAQSKQDTAAARKVSDSTLALVDRSCLVKSPERPSDFYDAERAINDSAEQATLKAADFSSPQDLGYASDKTIAILTGQASDASASEKSAVQAKDAELKSLLGLRPAQEERVGKQKKAGATRDTVTPAPAPAPAAPPMPSGAVAVNQCMMKNVEAHQAEIEALGNRGNAAQKAGNTPLMVAISDTIRMIQYAGCNGAR
jgi:hypothetical protein